MVSVSQYFKGGGNKHYSASQRSTAWREMGLETAGLGETVHFREEHRILEKVDRLAKSKGTDRSAIYREAVRYYLAANSHLTAEEKKDLGITATQ